MKFIAVALLFIGAVAAQTAAPAPSNDARVLAESLEKRGEALLASSKKALDELRASGHGNLAGAFEHQITLLEALVIDLKAQLADKTKVHQAHHIHVIEEDLLHLENQISDELRIAREAQNHQNRGDTGAQLVTRGEALVKNAQTQLPNIQGREARGVEHEIKAVQDLIKAIQAKPTGADLRADEQQLARHERTLQELLERASHRSGHRSQPLQPVLPGK